MSLGQSCRGEGWQAGGGGLGRSEGAAVSWATPGGPCRAVAESRGGQGHHGEQEANFQELQGRKAAGRPPTCGWVQASRVWVSQECPLAWETRGAEREPARRGWWGQGKPGHSSERAPEVVTERGA